MNLGLVREDFSFEAAKTLSSLFDQPDFSDVTLVCEDQKQIPAHKVILASASPFIKNITEFSQLIFFGSGKKETIKNKNIYSFGYILRFDPTKEL